MEIRDYNGEGRWSREEIVARYTHYAARLRIVPRDLSPMEHAEPGRQWVYPVMHKVIEGIKAGDAACVRIGIEFIEEDGKFAFGKTLKAKTARALRRALLTEGQKQRVRRRVFGMLEAGHIPHEFQDYARLVRAIGFDPREVPSVDSDDPYVQKFVMYFEHAVRDAGRGI